MVSSTLAAALTRRNIHYGWAVVAATSRCWLPRAPSARRRVHRPRSKRNSAGKTSEISSALAVRFVLFGFMGPFAAAFMNRFGLRRIILTALGIVVTVLAASLAMTSLWQLVSFVGNWCRRRNRSYRNGLTAMVLGATVATRWFSERRGLVMGMLSASTATGQLIFLPLLAKLTALYGWRISLCFVCAMIAIAAIVVFLLMRDRPADVGLPPFGADEIVPTPPHTESFGALLLTPLVVLRDAATTGAFWVLFGTFFICGLSTNGLIQTHFHRALR